MRIFQSFRRHLVFAGFIAHQSVQKNPFNRRVLLTVLSYTLSIISFNVYLFRVASTFFEYTNNIYTNSASTITVICYIILAFNQRKMFENFELLEKNIADCKQKSVPTQLKIMPVQFNE